MSKRDWSRAKRMRSFGTEEVASQPPLLSALKPRRRAPSKAELRAEAERALREWKGRQPRPNDCLEAEDPR
jgi:hypothetical protein